VAVHLEPAAEPGSALERGLVLRVVPLEDGRFRCVVSVDGRELEAMTASPAQMPAALQWLAGALLRFTLGRADELLRHRLRGYGSRLLDRF
jgi:hypothetical protein